MSEDGTTPPSGDDDSILVQSAICFLKEMDIEDPKSFFDCHNKFQLKKVT